MVLDTIVLVAALVGLGLGVRGAALLVTGLRCADEPGASLRVIRGIRGLAVAIGTAALAAGVLSDARWALAFGAVFLLEELYETGVVALVLRAAEHDVSSAGCPPPPSSSSSPTSSMARPMS
jgi:hypothetical protein